MNKIIADYLSKIGFNFKKTNKDLQRKQREHYYSNGSKYGSGSGRSTIFKESAKFCCGHCGKEIIVPHSCFRGGNFPKLTIVDVPGYTGCMGLGK